VFKKIQAAWKRFYHRLYRKTPFLRELQAIRQDADRLRIRTEHLLDLSHGLYTNLAFAAYHQLLAADPRHADPKRLARHGLSVNSQNGEDGIIDEIFRRIGTTDRVFVEIGIGDGLENNTAFLLSQGWRGFWVDGNESFIPNIEPALAGREGRLQWRTRYVDRENIAGVLGEMAVPAEFDLLSLDIDQNTLFVWEGLAAFRPRVAVIEYNAAIPARVDWSVRYGKDRTWDGSQNYGASLKAFERVGAALGYRLVGCDFNGVNAFFVRADLVGDHFAAPFTAENHFEPARFSLIHRTMHRRGILDLPD
jgi:hypothetical protein